MKNNPDCEKEYQQLISDIGKIITKGRKEVRKILKKSMD